MNALVLCESSGIWSSLLWSAGFSVLQVDLACSPGPVFPGWIRSNASALQVPPADWDVVVAFPPCTNLSSAGGDRWAEKAAADPSGVYPDLVLLTHCARLCASARLAGLLENPRGIAARALGCQSLEVHPWEWADCYRQRYAKRTGLWLYRWPPPFSRWTGDSLGSSRHWVSQPGMRTNRQSRRSVGWEGMAGAFIAALFTLVTPSGRFARHV